MRKYAVVVLILMAVVVVGSRLLPGNPPHAPGKTDNAPGAAMAAVTLPDALSERAMIGKRAFDAKCASCHGANAAGQNGVAPPLIHKYYEPSHHGDAAFHVAVKNGVRAHHWSFGDMPPVEGLSRADVDNIVAYVREIQRANGID